MGRLDVSGHGRVIVFILVAAMMMKVGPRTDRVNSDLVLYVEYMMLLLRQTSQHFYVL